MELKKFEVGKTYWCEWPGTTYTMCWTVIRRTPKSVTIGKNGLDPKRYVETKTCRISDRLSRGCGAECVFPEGSRTPTLVLDADFTADWLQQ